MRQELNTSFGIYRPSFLKIFIERDEDFSNLNILENVPLAVFFHEYIHFIQDVTTIAGLSNVSNTVDYIKYCNKVILAGKSRDFNIPIVPVFNETDNVYLNTELRKTYIGSSASVEIKQINEVTKEGISITDGKTKIDKHKIVLQCTKANSEVIEINFGNLAIMESMAFFCENKLFPAILPAPTSYPYKSAEMVIHKLYPELLNDPLNILALCDASLSMFDAGVYFVDMLKLMKEFGWKPNAPEDIYHFCEKNTKIDYHGVTAHDDFLKAIGDDAKSQLSSCFESPHYSANKHWINYTIDNGVNTRLNDPYFILDIVRGGDLKQNEKFITFFKKFGMPLLTNQQDVLLFHSPVQNEHELKPDALWVINQIYHIFLNFKPERRCELKMYCKEACVNLNVDDFTTENCYPSPWLRASEDPLCPFGAMWRTWGLTGYSPVVN